jgi:OmpR family two-component system sensor histidine kinase YxdK
MKGILKEHAGFIIVYFLNTVLFIAIFYLDLLNQNASVSISSLIYIFIFTLVLIVTYLAYLYVRQRKNYAALQKKIQSTEELLHLFDDSSYLFTEFNSLLKKQFQEFSKERARLQEEKSQYNTFINQWVHQMKTPLSVMSLLLQNAEAEGKMDAGLRNSLAEETEKLQNGLEIVLHAARLDAFEQDYKIERLDLSAIVSACIQEHKKAFIRHSVYPKMKIPNGVYVESDKKWLAFTIHQIISNAIKYSKGTTETITFQAKQDGHTLTLSIIDHGIGIPAQDLKRVFQPFFTGANGRVSAESTGMGLYLAKKICDRIGHQLKVDSEQGKGTTVSITFFNVTKM